MLDRSESVRDGFPGSAPPPRRSRPPSCRHRSTSAPIVAFDSKVYLLAGLDDDALRSMASTIRQLTPAGGTSLFDAVYKTCRDEFEAPTTGRTSSSSSPTVRTRPASRRSDDALRMAQLAHAAVYVLGVRAEDSLNSREPAGPPRPVAAGRADRRPRLLSPGLRPSGAQRVCSGSCSRSCETDTASRITSTYRPTISSTACEWSPGMGRSTCTRPRAISPPDGRRDQ